jgi:hypothetical protein
MRCDPAIDPNLRVIIMVSAYGYATLANLEGHAKRDYSVIDATIFSDTNVEVAITNAESFIIGYTGTILTAPIPCDIQLVTCQIAKTLLDNVLKERGIGGKALEGQPPVTKFLDLFDIKMILDKYRMLYYDAKSVFISKETHIGGERTYTRPWSY